MRRRRWILAGAAGAALLAIVLVLVLSGGGGHERRPPPKPRADHGLEIALQDNAVFLERKYYDRDVALGQARQMGVSWMRTNLLWARVEPSPGRFDWSQYDSLVDAARKAGMSVEMSLTGPAPAWATGNAQRGVFRPDPVKFGALARAAAEHFNGRVPRYSIWNEPNFISWLRPLDEAPGIYRRLYQAGWAAVKGVDPRAQVLIGETAAYAKRGRALAPLAFLHQVACRGCPQLHADGYAHHPYEFTDPPESSYPGSGNVTIGTLDRLTRSLDSLARDRLLATPRGEPLPVYLTEFGYFASGRYALPASVRADWLVRAYSIAERMYPRVRQLLQYLLVAPPPSGPAADSFDTSVVARSGAPEAPFSALAAWAARERRLGRVAGSAP
ncbi:MAG: beta-galactosidase [Thermoleophilaceae bacterium]